MDRRLTPSNGRVAAFDLKGHVDAERFTAGEVRQVTAPTATIWRAASAEHPDRELLFGETFIVLEDRSGFAFGRSARDGYCGYVRSAELGHPTMATHIVLARSTHVYEGASIKTPHVMVLSFGSRIRLTELQGRFAKTHDGYYVPQAHICQIGTLFPDPVTVAELFLGTPYLWAGNSGFGIDCSGLVQASLLACGIPCPGDTDLQEQEVGRPLAATEATRRGDLLFWKGHVAIAVNADQMIHANAHRMLVNYEPIGAAITRIAAAGEGPVTSRRRV